MVMLCLNDCIKYIEEQYTKTRQGGAVVSTILYAHFTQ